MPHRIDLTGKTFGRLAVTGFSSSRKTKGGTSKLYWSCLCECGNEAIVDGVKLKNGHTSSCGCLHKEGLIKLNKEVFSKHNETHTRLYRTWTGMKSRCLNQNVCEYKDYGGRGIKLCDDWHSFDVFAVWAKSNGYDDDLTIERINVNGNYCPENCCFIPMSKQGQNKRNNKHITMFDETKCMAEWSRDSRCQVKLVTFKARLRKGWNPELALLSPAK